LPSLYPSFVCFTYHLLFPYLFADNERYYNQIYLIFLELNPNVNSFDIYCPSWEYLKDSPKFVSISKALQSNPSIWDKKKRSELPEAVTLFSPEGTSGSDEAEAASGKKIP
jgi:hypothetical protein